MKNSLEKGGGTAGARSILPDIPHDLDNTREGNDTVRSVS